MIRFITGAAVGFCAGAKKGEQRMYREDGWVKGHYIDNHRKYECTDCGKQFIIGEKSLEDCTPAHPCCPYCGQIHVELISRTDDDDLQELSSDLGCLAICIELEEKDKMTRADKIRSMTNDEMVDCIMETGIDECFHFCKNNVKCDDLEPEERNTRCRQCLLEYLEGEYEES